MQQVSTGHYLGKMTASRVLSNFVVVESKYSAGQELKWHSHERSYISIVLQGSYMERCGSSSLHCGVGQVILHAADEVHSDEFFEEGHCLNLEIQPHFADRLRQYGIDSGTRLAMSSRRYMRLGLTLRSEAVRCDTASELVIEGLAMEVIAQLIRIRAIDANQRKEHWLELVNEMLHERYRESITLKELADASQVHPVHLARAFRKRYGCSVGDYVRRLRVAGASSEIVDSDMSIAEIASRNGFSDQSHLCRMMREFTGKSPRQLRPKKVSS